MPDSDHTADSSTVPSDALTNHFYDQMREIASRAFASERADHTLQPTAVVNEACLRLMTTSPLPEVSRAERLALASRVMKQVLIDHSRAKAAKKRGGAEICRIELEPEMASDDGETFVEYQTVHDAIDRLRTLHQRQAEVMTFRIFGGLSMQQIAEVLGVSKRTTENDWTVARAWLRRELAAHMHGVTNG